ncbi:MAG: hypothetical protein M1813_009210 [Trichoglossum hirsutum]|nr:MAG: hypothetical protein M1813_009210 [Trichoglossum hirsutum]
MTSRDQTAIGSVGKGRCLMERLKSEEAVAVLFERAGVRNPSSGDYEQAQAIAKLLLCLPLAMEQGWAYIRASQKTLAEYGQLYQDRQHEVLKSDPQIGEVEKTVLTAWEVNFRQVERNSKEVSNLLLLFCFLDPTDISKAMLYRGCVSQKRWGSHGEMIETNVAESGLDGDLVALITNEIDFDAAIEKLLSFSLIYRNKNVEDSRSFSIHPLVQYCVSLRVAPAIQNKWRLQAILLVCHSFPRYAYFEPLYGDLGRRQLPHVRRILKEYDALARESQVSTPVKRELASTLLSATRFWDKEWKHEALGFVKDLLQGDIDCYIHAEAAHRESAISRLFGDLKASNQSLEGFIHSTVVPGHDEGLETDSRWNAHRGDLVVSFAENLIQGDEGDALSRAKGELYEWQPISPESPSTMERLVLRSRDRTLGRILRDEGRFQEAFTHFERVLEESEGDDLYKSTGWFPVLLSNIAELHCELHRPAGARDILQPALADLTRKNWQDVSYGRRLQLSMAESLIQCGSYDEAEEYLRNLQRIYEDLPNPDMPSRAGHFRVWAGLARMSHLGSRWDEALVRWGQALKKWEDCGFGEGSVSGVIHYSIAHILLELGNLKESQEAVELAQANLGRGPRRFWIVGLCSYWYDFVDRAMAGEKALEQAGLGLAGLSVSGVEKC